MKKSNKFVALLALPLVVLSVLFAAKTKEEPSSVQIQQVIPAAVDKSEIKNFEPSYVQIKTEKNTINAINQFGMEEDFAFTWYVNRVEDGYKSTNVYKSGGWSKERDFSFTIEDISDRNSYILIAYIKKMSADDRTSRIAAEFSLDENGQIILSGEPMDVYGKDYLIVSNNGNSITVTNSFNPFGPQLFTWYLYQDSMNNNIYKGTDWSDDNTFTFEGSPDKDYFVRAYVKDVINNRNNAVIGPIRINKK